MLECVESGLHTAQFKANLSDEIVVQSAAHLLRLSIAQRSLTLSAETRLRVAEVSYLVGCSPTATEEWLCPRLPIAGLFVQPSVVRTLVSLLQSVRENKDIAK